MSESPLADRLQAMRDELHARLYASNSDYRDMIVLDSAISMARASSEPATRVKDGHYVKVQGDRPLSQADAAVAVLEETGEPQTLFDLLDLVTAKGVVIGGKRRDINLSSSLSRDDRLHSLSLGGVRKWWLAGIPIPGDDLLKEKLADEVPSESASASFNQKFEGR